MNPVKAELNKSVVKVDTMAQKNICQDNFWFQKDDTSSIENNKPPTGAPNAEATPAAAPALMKFLLQRKRPSCDCLLLHPNSTAPFGITRQLVSFSFFAVSKQLTILREGEREERDERKRERDREKTSPLLHFANVRRNTQTTTRSSVASTVPVLRIAKSLKERQTKPQGVRFELT